MRRRPVDDGALEGWLLRRRSVGSFRRSVGRMAEVFVSDTAAPIVSMRAWGSEQRRRLSMLSTCVPHGRAPSARPDCVLRVFAPSVCTECLRRMRVWRADLPERHPWAKAYSERLFDDDNTGTISLKNLKRVSKELGETMTEEELREMVERADTNGDGLITQEDFYTIMTKKTFP